MLGGPIEVRRYGDKGHEVVLLHGGPGAQGSMASLAAAMAPTHTVYEPWQRRGGGRRPLSVRQHIDDLAEVAPERAAYVGWSWGAMLGLSFAAAHPDRVSSLTLVGCGTYGEETRETYSKALRSRLGHDGRMRLEDLEARLERATDPEWRDDLFGQMGELVERASAVEPLGFTAGDTHPDAAGHFETWNDVLRLQHEQIEPRTFTLVELPVLMLHGDEDPHPGTMIRDTLHEYMPHLAYVGFRRCGHVPWLEKHALDAFMATLVEWIDDTA